MTKEYVWEIQPMEEVKPFYVTTQTNSVAEAARLFEEQMIGMSIRYIRKYTVTEKVQYSDLDCWEVS